MGNHAVQTKRNALRHHLADGYGHVRTHGTTERTQDAVLRPGLIGGKVSQAIELSGNLEHLFGAYRDTQSAPFASIFFNIIAIGHAVILLLFLID
jgi:hypothetical protein